MTLDFLPSAFQLDTLEDFGIEKANVFRLRSQNLGTATAAVSSSSKVWRSSTQRSPELAWLPGLFSHQHLVWLVALTILKNISYLESLKPPTSSHLPSPSRRLTPHPQARYFATSQARLLLNVPTEIQQGFDHESAILRAPGHAPCPVAFVRLESEDGLLTCGFLRMPCLPPGHHHFYRWYVYQCQSWMVHDCFGECCTTKRRKPPTAQPCMARRAGSTPRFQPLNLPVNSPVGHWNLLNLGKQTETTPWNRLKSCRNLKNHLQ